MNESNIAQPSEKPLSGAEIVIQCLERAGVTDIFAYPGGQTIELHQAMSRSKQLHVILPRHEQGGAFAADGYARATGKTGVCMATSGPGATNLITGIADAYMDSVPMVVITGQVNLCYIGKNAFQETDIIGITRPIVKHSFLVLNIDDIPAQINQAFDLANSGRPGPVVVDIPKNIQQSFTVPKYPVPFRNQDYHTAHLPISPDDLETIRRELQKSRRPCIYAGGGVISANAVNELREFAHRFNIPVVTTLMGIGCFPQEDPLSLGMIGIHGCYCANYAANESDLLLAFGARFDDRVTGGKSDFAANAFIIHVDIDQSEINKNRHVNLGVEADLKDVLTELNKAPFRNDNGEWFAQIAEWKKDHPMRYVHKDQLQPQFIMETLSRLTDEKAIIVPGVGQHQMWAAQYYKYHFPRQLLTSGGLGSMGFGLPAAMGAKIAKPDSLIINIDGDGSFLMNIQELGTLPFENVDIKMIVMNNQQLGMVAQMEDRFYGQNRGNTCLKNHFGNRPYPDFVTIARGFGVDGLEVWKKEELEDALKTMLSHKGPFVLDCHIGYNEHVLPIIPFGKNYREIIEA